MHLTGTRRTLYVAGLAWGLTVASAVAAVAIRLVSRAPIPENRSQLGEASFFTFGVLILAFATTGLVIVSRRPRHPIGWVLLVIGGLYGLSATAGAFTFHLLATSPVLTPLTLWTAWMIGITVSMSGLALFVLIWLFPDGRSPFRAPWLPALLAMSVVVQVAWSFAGRNWVIPALPSPVTPPAALGPLTAAIGTLAPPLTAALGAIGMIAIVVVRVRRARGIERQQLKWFAFAALLAVATLIMTALAAWLMPGRGPLGELPVLAFQLSQALIPIAVAIAILRYRLYDIDLLINRTLVYGALTASLAALYIGSVIVLQGLLSGFAGGGSLAVAASTLGVAALFQPVRRRVQQTVDRRFYRSRYDAARTLEAFTVRLRDEVDLTRLTDELASSVEQSLQPASVSVWIRQPEVSR